MSASSIKDLVLRSLIAVSEKREADFYTTLFQAQAPERFAMILVDRRCLLNPLLKSFISDLKILSNLKLTPILVLGGLDNAQSYVSYDSQKLAKEMDAASIQYSKLNCASYELAPHVRNIARAGKIPLLELSHTDHGLPLEGVVNTFKPAKLIFLKPSGGLHEQGKLISVLKLGDIPKSLESSQISPGQRMALQFIEEVAPITTFSCTYILASPLNLLAELFTTKGSGTMVRKSATIIAGQSYKKFNIHDISASIESAFERKLKSEFLTRKPSFVFMDSANRGGAIFFTLGGVPYMSKFWVTREAQGEGIASDIWHALEANIPMFFWRSRKDNPFNEWYMRMCDGMQVSGPWRVFWKGVPAPEIPQSILAAASAPIDFRNQ